MKHSFKHDAGPVSARQLMLRIVFGITAAVVAVALLYWIGRKIELGPGGQREVRGELTGRFEQPRTVDYHGTAYQYREDLLTVLLMGIDQTGAAAGTSTGFRNGGQADFLLLLVFDSKAKTITPIHVDRDTMAEITVLGVLGNPAGTRHAQICLSHGFGDGGPQSCLYTADAVSKLLYGVDIHFYIAINLDAIATINNALKGAPITLKDDSISLDPAMAKGGGITLMGDQGIGFLGELFDALGTNLQTNMSRGRMITEFYGSRNFEKKDIVVPAGEYRVGEDGFMEYHVDGASLKKWVVELFFAPQEAL